MDFTFPGDTKTAGLGGRGWNVEVFLKGQAATVVTTAAKGPARKLESALGLISEI